MQHTNQSLGADIEELDYELLKLNRAVYQPTDALTGQQIIGEWSHIYTWHLMACNDIKVSIWYHDSNHSMAVIIRGIEKKEKWGKLFANTVRLLDMALGEPPIKDWDMPLVIQEIYDTIIEFGERVPAQNLIITGHSMGSTIATIIAPHMQNIKFCFNKRFVISFQYRQSESPARYIFNYIAARFFGNILLKVKNA